MPEPVTIAAVDCGAESGRVMLVAIDAQAGGVDLQEVHRFPTRRLDRADGLHWDWDHQLAEIEAGLTAAARACPQLDAIAVDTWGVDYVLVDADGRPLDAPWCHRDGRGMRGQRRLDGIWSRGGRFHASGIAQLPINTLDQLAAQAVEEPELLARARHLLFLPDAIAHHLCGVVACERSILATSACADAGAQRIDCRTLDTLGVPCHLLPEPVASGSVLGTVRAGLAQRLGLPAECRVVATAGHDTSAAVAALPTADAEAVYLSSGTWSLIGMVIDQPLLSESAFRSGLSNEGHWDGRMRLNRNVMGLWILQQCRAAWAAEGREWAYADLATAAAAVTAPLPLAVDDPRFLSPGTAADPMPARVRAWLHEHGQMSADSDAVVARSIIDGLAQAYAAAVRGLAAATGREAASIQVLGGGGRNALLAQATADATGLPVHIGPAEATALGNALVAAVGLQACTATDLPRLAASQAPGTVYLPSALALS